MGKIGTILLVLLNLLTTIPICIAVYLMTSASPEGATFQVIVFLIVITIIELLKWVAFYFCIFKEAMRPLIFFALYAFALSVAYPALFPVSILYGVAIFLIYQRNVNENE